MDFNKLGKMAETATRCALELIREERNVKQTVRYEDNPYVRGGKSVSTGLDVRTQRVYTDLFMAETPAIGITAEEKDPDLKNVRGSRWGTWVIDGLDGTKRMLEGATWGYGTQCALLLADGSVPIAFVGDAATGDIFGYYGTSGVFRIDKDGRRSWIKDIPRKKSLTKLDGLRRPTIDLYHPLSRRVLLSDKIGGIRELSGGIGTTMARLLTDQIGLFALRPHHERPWDAIPAYALCANADMVFLTPARDGQGLVEWKPTHTLDTYMRDFDLLVVHRTRAAALHKVAEQQ